MRYEARDNTRLPETLRIECKYSLAAQAARSSPGLYVLQSLVPTALKLIGDQAVLGNGGVKMLLSPS